MPKKRQKLQEAVRGRYTPIPHELLDSQKFIGLSHIAKALLFDALRQHNGRNNGHIQLSEKWLKARGWVSGETIQRARRELVSAGLLLVTHAGGLNRGATLYGFSWLDVTDHKGLDIPAGQFIKGGWRDAQTPIATPCHGVVSADAPASENYKERTDHRCSATPTIGVAKALTTPTIGVRKGVFDHSTTPTIGDNETVASYPPLKSTATVSKKERKERARLTVNGPATQKSEPDGMKNGAGDFALLPTSADAGVAVGSLTDDALPADEPENPRGQKQAHEVESLPLPF